MTHTKEEYTHVIQELKKIQVMIDAFLQIGKNMKKDMREIAPGLWIHNKYQNLSECLVELNSWLPI